MSARAPRSAPARQVGCGSADHRCSMAHGDRLRLEPGERRARRLERGPADGCRADRRGAPGRTAASPPTRARSAAGAPSARPPSRASAGRDRRRAARAPCTPSNVPARSGSAAARRASPPARRRRGRGGRAGGRRRAPARSPRAVSSRPSASTGSKSRQPPSTASATEARCMRSSGFAIHARLPCSSSLQVCIRSPSSRSVVRAAEYSSSARARSAARSSIGAGRSGAQRATYSPRGSNFCSCSSGFMTRK